MQSDLHLYDNRLVITRAERLTVLDIYKCRAHAQGSVQWLFPGSAIEEMVERCHTCVKLLPIVD